MRLLLLLVLGGIALSGCLNTLVQQGNVIDSKQAALIAVGDTRFRVESQLGTPVLKDILHPNRAVYVESYEDKQTGELRNRHIIVTYDQSLRVQSIDRSQLKPPTTATP